MSTFEDRPMKRMAQAGVKLPAAPVLAFPTIGEIPIHPDQTGMSLRDYFGAKALQGLLAGGRVVEQVDDVRAAAVAAKSAYVLADAMMKERV